MKVLLAILAAITIVACQQPANNNGSNGAGNAPSQALQDNSKVGPVGSEKELLPSYSQNPERNLEGEWTTHCLSQEHFPHVPYLANMRYYTLTYIFDTENRAVAHMVRTFQDPECEEDFGGPLQPNVAEVLIIKGFYQITRVDPISNKIRINFTWNPNSPIDSTRHSYLFQPWLAALRSARNSNKQILYWGFEVRNNYGGYASPYNRGGVPYGYGGGNNSAGNLELFDFNRSFYRVTYDRKL